MDDPTRSFLARFAEGEEGYLILTIATGERSDDGTRAFYNLRFSHTQLDEMIRTAQRHDAKGDDVYFAYARFGEAVNEKNRPLRNTSNALSCTVFIIDLDVKAGRYQSRREALQAAQRAWTTASLKGPNIICVSGNGLHLYWMMDQALPRREWKPYAYGFAKMMQDAGLDFDVAVSNNMVGVLRVPGTHNHKDPAEPKPVILFRNTPSYSRSELLGLIQPIHVNGGGTEGMFDFDPSGASGFGDAGDDDELSEGARKKPTLLEPVIPECRLLQDAINSGGRGHTEPLWRGLLALASFCEDGEKYAHLLSKGHDGYSPETVDTKLAQIEAAKGRSGFGPTLCTRLDELYKADHGGKNPHCGTCPYRQQIKTPLGAPYAANILPGGYVCRDNGVFLIKPFSPGEEPEKPRFVSSYRMRHVELGQDEVGQDYVMLDVYMGARPRKFVAPVGKVGDMHNFLKVVGDQNLVFLDREQKPAREMMVTFAQTLQAISERKRVPTKMGWFIEDGRPLFVHDGMVFAPGGRSWENPLASRPGLHAYTRRGDFAKWQEAASFIMDDNRPETHAIIASAFAGPLVRMTGMPGLTINFMSKNSGYGKSVFMKLAQSVWGHARGGMHNADDTINSLIAKLSMMGSLPAYFDEVRLRALADAMVAIFRMAQGKEKARLSKDGKQLAADVFNALLIMAGNHSISDVMGMDQDSNAGLARILEVVMSLIQPGGHHSTDIDAAVKSLDDHHGHLAWRYVPHLVDRYEEINKRVEVEIRRFTPMAEAKRGDYAGRFVASLAAIMVVGAELGQRNGMPKLDPHLVEQCMVSALASNRMERVLRSRRDNSGDALADFLTEQQGHRAIFSGQGVIASPERYPLAYAIDLLHKQIRVDAKKFEEWLVKQRRSSKRDMMAYLHGSANMQVVIEPVVPGIPILTGPRKRVMLLDCIGPYQHFIM